MPNELYHYGIKGMKWGVRRTREELGGTEEGDRKARAVAAAMSRENYKEAKAFRKKNDAGDLVWEEAHAKIGAKHYAYGLSKEEIKAGQELYNKLKTVGGNKTLDSLLSTAESALAWGPGSPARKRMDYLAGKVSRHTNKKGKVSIFGTGAASELSRMQYNSDFSKTGRDRFGNDWRGDTEKEIDRIRSAQQSYNQKHRK